MKVLIVHAHHEEKSFSSALADRARLSLESLGHSVEFSDLYKMGFDPVSDRRNFKTVKDAAFLKQQIEELYATENDGFVPEIDEEFGKLSEADLLIFSFPLWWFGMPAILKGWCDRVLTMGRVYGGTKFFENGLGQGKKRGLVLMTTGGGPQAYDGTGMNPSMGNILQPIHHGVFWFNGYLPMEPFIAWSPAHISDEARKDYLGSLDERLKNIFQEKPILLPPMSEFVNRGPDLKARFFVLASRKKAPDQRFISLVGAQEAAINELRRISALLDFEASSSDNGSWRSFMKFRAVDEAELKSYLESLPHFDYLDFEVTKIRSGAEQLLASR